MNFWDGLITGALAGGALGAFTGDPGIIFGLSIAGAWLGMEVAGKAIDS